MLFPASAFMRSDPFDLMRRTTRDFDPGFVLRTASAFPAVNAWQGAEAAAVTAELPGVEAEDIDVTVADDMMTIKGEKKVERREDKKGYYLSERSYGANCRTIPLPPGVDGEKAQASFKNGVLTVRLPQTPEAQARVKRIEVKSA